MPLIRGTALTGFSQLVTDLGGDSRRFAADAHISHDDIGRHDRFISLPRGAQMLEDVAGALNTPDLGRRLATRQGIEILGPVGLAGRNAETVAEAFAIFDKFMAAYSPSISARVVPHADPELHRFEFEYLLKPAPRLQAIELSMGVVLKVLRLFLGSSYQPADLRLPHAALTEPETYRAYFGCRTYFCEPIAAFTLRTADLQRRLPVDRLAHQTAIDFLSATVGDHRPTTSDDVGTLIRQLLPSGAVRLDDVARYLDMHPKALQRRLAAEGCAFGDLVDEIRRDTARRLLRDTDMTLDHLCRELGYAEQSVLTRSCRRWFGMTPTEFRRYEKSP
ncbi:AraC family transcriptional regulator [Gordonia sp. X0973]|uniref:AraC family transcriptional regulator n=1 Tax=Gordonia sp. X0973 TaxID=2742602 RepID=UPI000F53B1B9|nr:AraC family transcriptional regulator [Gordonia sp. X0973]QKT08011.1 AraC family transcriptional regulator [Gordonia sp. X0973]